MIEGNDRATDEHFSDQMALKFNLVPSPHG